MSDKYLIKYAGLKDYEGIAKVHVDTWISSYKGIISDRRLRSMSYEKSGKKWFDIISACADDKKETVLSAFDKNEPVGFCHFGRLKRKSELLNGFEGEIKAIYILKDHQKKGLGGKLIKKITQIFKNNGIDSFIAWVLKDNSSADFYVKTGAELITETDLTIGEQTLKGLCFGWRNILKGP